MGTTVLDPLLQSLPQVGIGGAICWVLILLLRRESASEARYSAEYERINSAHDAELRELREQIQALRTQIDQLQAKLDIEREERRRAEDLAAQATRRGSGETG